MTTPIDTSNPTSGDPASASPAVDAAHETATLIADLTAYINRYVVMTEQQTTCVALWVLHSHAVDAAEQTPYLNPRSAEKQSGKTRLLEVLELLCPRTFRWTLPSDAVVYRTIEKFGPTLLLDETDAIWSEKNGDKYEGLRALLNSGNRRGATVPRCIGPTHSLEMFPTFCAKAIAGIGVPPDTVADRSIPIVLKRRRRDEQVERFRLRDGRVSDDAADLEQRCEAWAGRHTDGLRDVWPELPDELTDRQQDVAEPLLAIADLAGGAWGDWARESLVETLRKGAASADESLRMRLLADTWTVLADSADPWIGTADLIAKLEAIEDAPWGEPQLTPRKLAWLLKPYEVIPQQHRFPDGANVKGYERAKLEDAWARYLPPPAG